MIAMDPDNTEAVVLAAKRNLKNIILRQFILTDWLNKLLRHSLSHVYLSETCLKNFEELIWKVKVTKVDRYIVKQLHTKNKEITKNKIKM